MGSSDRRVALVTGGNRGIGREVARRLAEAGLTVVIGARDLAAGERAAKGIQDELTVDGPEVIAVHLDVAARDDEFGNAHSAAEEISRRYGRLDILINNAGRMVEVRPQDIIGKDLEAAFITNVGGVAETTHACLPLLKQAEAPRIVNVSSTTASLKLTAEDKDFGGDHSVRAAYSTSKAALNMLTLHYNKAFQADESLSHIKVNAITPGYVATEMNRGLGARTVEQGARALVALALRGEDSPTGGYFNEDGPLPW
ncbi:NAD(P)-dependent dehydrogenase (short-subunit alcohol dehydrogenase family) [Spinactinospora alkalitolerans]|uniref:NAD(P)-dependent dehydrogenase (Short-subunit alcohol dehydrogenase family) n=1 Tax=Spinactinospora alkalitolerans TaxID=687207 RepID=A0A852U4N6_9ACTN|nr:SDR family NAD(P)-dependent oxidoreductase [Spinactinospora alkalitolerans]NYE50462.1 NAD(P)-dependent dehydrogenase (short-subunit alcohol dehydrogenase family) [Spinactinospora alkalitolerans]